MLNLCLNNSNAFLEKDSLSIYLSTWNILNIVLKSHGVHRWTPSKLKISVKKYQMKMDMLHNVYCILASLLIHMYFPLVYPNYVNDIYSLTSGF